MPLLEFALARYDETCNVRFAGEGFGSDGYAFGLPRFSWLKIPMSNQIRSYTESGYIQELAAKYLARPRCENFLVGTANPYGLEHTGGLFIILVFSVVLSVIFLLLEHLAYHYLVPWLRRQPVESFWKRESFAFISQRVFRVVRSEHLYSQKQAAQEMIKIVKQRDFTRLIQKNELQKRRMPTQKKVKTKAEVFQEITANIVSYHRQLQSASEEVDNMDASDLDEEYVQDHPNGSPEDCRVGTRTPVDSMGDEGIQNGAYSGGSSCSTVASQRRHGYRSNTVLSIDDDDNVVFVDDTFLEEDEDEFMSPKRKGSSRSFAFQYKGSQKWSPYQAPRKLSDSPSLYPPWGHRPQHASYVLPLSSRFNTPPSLTHLFASSTVRDPSRISDLDNNHEHIKNQSVQCRTNSLEMLKSKEQNSNRLSHPSTEGEDVDSGAIRPMENICTPSDSVDRSYYYSPTSSSVQTVSDEQREFSPLSSPATPNTDEDFPSCMETSFTSNTAHQPPDTNHQARIIKSSAQLEQSEISLHPVTLASTDDLTNLSQLPVQKKQGQPGVAASGDLPDPPGERGSHTPTSLEVLKYPQPLFQTSMQMKDGKIWNSKYQTSDSASLVGNQVKLKGVRRNNSAVFTIEEEARGNVMSALKGTAAHRRASLDSQHVNNTRRLQAHGDYFKRNLRLKDNRVKSTLRHHAMSGYQSQIPVDYIDDCTLEALSKEDVLLLWRKSELDLESRLHEVLARNRRLSLAIDYLTKQDSTEHQEDV
ncbi:glutamate receptor ionotropic, nmda 3a [Plakobranchus ocellatus]|uniref:Glutamate receptor ionotropic, nmda 3a n=1 Tax=Plakobranchus ocellatus TaxID=259542 RepID=A0AAV3XSE0_9GAST|nr:glutamate receptor ionotropic, nmda 3a [Plakobranchus ocellatus]